MAEPYAKVVKVHVFGFGQRKYQPTSEDSVLALFVGWYFTWTFLRLRSAYFFTISLSLALKSPVSSLASRQDEIANFVSRFHGILVPGL